MHPTKVSICIASDLGLELFEHTPYSPDLAPSDYHVFPQLKKSLTGR